MNTFATARLIATRLAPDDLDDLVRLHLDAEVSRFLGGVRTPEVTAQYLETNLRHWADHGFGLWVLRSPGGGFVGRAGLRFIELDGRQELEIAYTLARDAWGRGLATEIAEALVDLWRTRCTHPSLVGVVMQGNVGSERVLSKTGFHYARDAVFHGATVSVLSQARFDEAAPVGA